MRWVNLTECHGLLVTSAPASRLLVNGGKSEVDDDELHPASTIAVRIAIAVSRLERCCIATILPPLHLPSIFAPRSATLLAVVQPGRWVGLLESRSQWAD